MFLSDKKWVRWLWREKLKKRTPKKQISMAFVSNVCVNVSLFLEQQGSWKDDRNGTPRNSFVEKGMLIISAVAVVITLLGMLAICLMLFLVYKYRTEWKFKYMTWPSFRYQTDEESLVICRWHQRWALYQWEIMFCIYSLIYKLIPRIHNRVIRLNKNAQLCIDPWRKFSCKYTHA